MRIIFFGSGKIGAGSLEALYDAGHDIVLVVTRPDKPKGRHLKASPTEIKRNALELKLKIHQPENPNSQETIKIIKELNPDIFIVIAYGHILQNSLLNIPKLYPLNLHASLLPKYRGAAPINWAVLNGEKETGLSVIKMIEKMDAGDIMLYKKISINEDDTALTLQDKLLYQAELAAVEAVSLIEHKKEKFIPQDAALATYAPKLAKKDGRINWQTTNESIKNQIRAMQPWPCAWTYLNKKTLKIFNAKISGIDNKANPGEIFSLSKDSLTVACGNGALEITELQLENEKRLDAGAFLCGHKLKVGDKLGE